MFKDLHFYVVFAGNTGKSKLTLQTLSMEIKCYMDNDLSSRIKLSLHAMTDNKLI